MTISPNDPPNAGVVAVATIGTMLVTALLILACGDVKPKPPNLPRETPPGQQDAPHDDKRALGLLCDGFWGAYRSGTLAGTQQRTSLLTLASQRGISTEARTYVRRMYDIPGGAEPAREHVLNVGSYCETSGFPNR